MAPDQNVFVCENPRVLEAIAERALGGVATVCTSGRSTLVVLEVLRRLARSGARIRYHGDFDWPGVAMANQLVAMFEVEPWHMSGFHGVGTTVPHVAGFAGIGRHMTFVIPWRDRRPAHQELFSRQTCQVGKFELHFPTWKI